MQTIVLQSVSYLLPAITNNTNIGSDS